MATIKALHGSKSLKKVIDYITNPNKAEVITGVNCNTETALDEMITTKNLYKKTGGRTYIHLVQSWHKDEDFFTEKEKEELSGKSEKKILNAKAQKANEIAQKLIKDLPLFKGHEVIIATHIDRDHIHNHIIVNSVNFENGYKFQSSAHDLQDIKDKSDEICMEYGLTVTEKGKTFERLERDETSTYTKEARWVQEQAEKKHIKSYSESKAEFIEILGKNNIGVIWEDTHKYITFIDLQRLKDGEKKYKVRDKSLNEYFGIGITKEGLESGFKERVRTAEISRNSSTRTNTDNNKSTEPYSRIANIQREIDRAEREIARIGAERNECAERERAIKEREKQARMAVKAKSRERSEPEKTNQGYGR